MLFSLVPFLISLIGSIRKRFLKEPLYVAAFEFWLNHFSDLSPAENYEIRAKIVGKMYPRDRSIKSFFRSEWKRLFQGPILLAAHFRLMLTR